MRSLLLLGAFLLAAVAACGGDECKPACRSGFECVSGECVSECNPPCEAHEECRRSAEGAYCSDDDEIVPDPPGLTVPDDDDPWPDDPDEALKRLEREDSP